MNSIDLIRGNLERSQELVLEKIEDMADHALVPPTVNGGCHTLWLLGHLAYIETLLTHSFMKGEPNPHAPWEALFDGDEVSDDPAAYPPFAEVLATCHTRRAETLSLLDSLCEADLDRVAVGCPAGHERFFGTWRACLQYLADHWLMHRGQLADCRRAAGLHRMWC